MSAGQQLVRHERSEWKAPVIKRKTLNILKMPPNHFKLQHSGKIGRMPLAIYINMSDSI